MSEQTQLFRFTLNRAHKIVERLVARINTEKEILKEAVKPAAISLTPGVTDHILKVSSVADVRSCCKNIEVAGNIICILKAKLAERNAACGISERLAQLEAARHQIDALETVLSLKKEKPFRYTSAEREVDLAVDISDACNMVPASVPESAISVRVKRLAEPILDGYRKEYVILKCRIDSMLDELSALNATEAFEVELDISQISFLGMPS